MITKFFKMYPAAHLVLTVAYAVLFGAAALAVADLTHIPDAYGAWVGFTAALLTSAASLTTYAWILRDNA